MRVRDFRSKIVVRKIACLLCAWIAGCSDADSTRPTGDAGALDASAHDSGTAAAGDAAGDAIVATDASDATAAPIGTFQIAIADADPESGRPPYTGVFGVVYDRPPPPDGVIFAVDRQQGECQLLVPAIPFCEPGCGVDAVCTADDVCTPYAVGQNLGPVDVEGLLPSAFRMDAIAPGYKYQPSGDVHFPYPPCAEGDVIRVSAHSVGVHMESRCVAPLVLGGGAAPIVVRARRAVALTWTAPADLDASRVAIELDIAHHGGAKGKIRCDVPDNGAFEIPEPLVTELVGLGLAGFPLITITRSATASADVAKDVHLTVSSSTSRLVDTGVISCGDELACPTGLSCQTDRTCQ
jgi:hypothetical protein